MSTIPHSSVPESTWQSGFMRLMPAIQVHANITFRRLRPVHREEAVAEATAAALVAYRRLAAQGRLHVAHPSTLALRAVQRVRGGRHVGGHQDSANDLMSPPAQIRHNFQIASYNTIDHETGEWIWSDIEGRRTSIPDLAAFRIDFAHWLKTLTGRNRRIVNLLAIGERTSAVAERFGLSWGRVSQLRRKFERWWYTFQGETVEAAA